MIVLSSFLRRAVYPVMSGAGMFSRGACAGDVRVLTYHGVLPEGSGTGKSPADGALLSAEQFRRQLRFLKSRYELITPDAFRGWLKSEGPLPPRAVLLTCDDGLLSALTEMAPILLEEGARCLVFVTGASLEEDSASLWYEELYRMLEDAPGDAGIALGGTSVRKESIALKNLAGYWWRLVQQLSELNGTDRRTALWSLRTQWRLPRDWRMYDPEDARAERRYRLLNRSELRQLVTQGMTVGAHTMSHPILAKMPPESAEREIRECRSCLELFLQQEVWALAYPFGHEGSAGAREMKLAEESGYSCAFLNHGGGLSRRASPRFGLPRAHVTAEMTLSELEAHLSGFHERLQRRFRGGGASLSAARMEA